jgi:hypothetical protein
MRAVSGAVRIRVKRILKRIQKRRQARADRAQPAAEVWAEMIGRVGAADAERRLSAAESALNQLR